MFFNFFKTRPVRQFQHVPIYWDKDKEEREDSRERIRQEVENEHGNPNLRPKSTLKRGFLTNQRKEKALTSQTNTFRMALVIGLLVACLAFMFK